MEGRVRLVMSLLLPFALAACPGRANVECEDNGNCDRFGGGTCQLAPSGNEWCAYPDIGCPDGLRYSDLDVGDGLSGLCVGSSPAGSDGGTDTPVSSGDGSGDSSPACPRELLFQRGTEFADPEVYRVDLTSLMESRVSNGTDQDDGAGWSPDGSKVVVARNGNSIYTLAPDGSNPFEVGSTTGAFSLGPPYWSPDGSRIIWLDFPVSGNGSLMSGPATSMSPISLLSGQNIVAVFGYSPDGTKILVAADVSSVIDLYVTSSTGNGFTNISHGTFESPGHANWSPDSTKITFDGHATIHVVDADGTDAHSYVNLDGHANAPAFSADGTHLFFAGDSGVWVMSSLGAGAQMILPSRDNLAVVVPSPDGTQIAFADNRDGSGADEIYVANVDGSNVVRLTNNQDTDGSPHWRPCPH